MVELAPYLLRQKLVLKAPHRSTSECGASVLGQFGRQAHREPGEYRQLVGAWAAACGIAVLLHGQQMPLHT